MGSTSQGNVKKTKTYDLMKILEVILQNSTIMPFRFCSNKFTCFYCCIPFENSIKLKQHTKEEHAETRNLSRIISALKTKRIKLDISELSCKLCPKNLDSLEDFLAHAATAHALKFNADARKEFFCYKIADHDLNCLECGQFFRSFSSLVKHMHKYHNKSKAFACDICGQAFIAKSTLRTHQNNIHREQKCDKCEKVFSSQYTLQVHCEKEHSEKCECPLCPEILASKYFKKVHMVAVHKIRKEHKCDICSKVLSTKTKLLNHISRTHLKEKSIACHICGFRVFNEQSLKNHLVRHSDARPFQCSFCSKKFQTKKYLDFHTRIHTNDKRYVCKECGKAFIQTSSLIFHVRVHHSGVKKKTEQKEFSE